MILLHTADLHLSSPMTARLSEERLIRRRRELERMPELLFTHGTERGAEAVLLVGDVFDSTVPTPSAVARFFEQICRFPDLPFFYVPGNHEGDMIEKRSDRPSNLHVLGDGEAVLLGTVRILGAHSPLTLAAMPALSRDTYNIVLLHAAVGEKTDKDTVRLFDLKEKGIDYLALGHYHTYTVYEENGHMTAVYPGSPEGRGYDETGPHGYVLVDTDAKKHTFVCKSMRRVWDIEVDLTDIFTMQEAERATEQVLMRMGVTREDLVRITLVGRLAPQALRDREAALTARFADRFFSFALRDKTRLLLNAADYAADPTLKGEFVRLLMSEDIDDTLRERILACGLTYLQEGGDER